VPEFKMGADDVQRPRVASRVTARAKIRINLLRANNWAGWSNGRKNYKKPQIVSRFQYLNKIQARQSFEKDTEGMSTPRVINNASLGLIETVRGCVPYLKKEKPEMVYTTTAAVIRNKSLHEVVLEEMARPTQGIREPLEILRRKIHRVGITPYRQKNGNNIVMTNNIVSQASNLRNKKCNKLLYFEEEASDLKRFVEQCVQTVSFLSAGVRKHNYKTVRKKADEGLRKFDLYGNEQTRNTDIFLKGSKITLVNNIWHLKKECNMKLSEIGSCKVLPRESWCASRIAILRES